MLEILALRNNYNTKYSGVLYNGQVIMNTNANNNNTQAEYTISVRQRSSVKCHGQVVSTPASNSETPCLEIS
jgi:hypothetical protein